MSPEQKKYFSRQTKLPFLGESGQEKLLGSSALVIGLGGLGSPAALHLATAGVGRIGLWDYDTVELSNLHRQTAFTLSDLGRKKTETTEDFLRARVPSIRIESFSSAFSENTAPSLLKTWDIVLDCTDYLPTKYAINRFCVQEGKPLVSASVFRTSAQIAIFSPEGRPCYSCLYPNLENSDLLSCADGGVLGVQTALAGVYQASFAIQYLLFPEKSPTTSCFFLEWESPLVYETKLEADSECVVCGNGNPKKQIRSEKLEIFAAEFSEWKHSKNVILVDVRESAERNEFPVGDSMFLPLSELSAANVSLLEREPTYITICESGVRSLKAAKIFRDCGYNAYSFFGGRKLLQITPSSSEQTQESH